MREELYDLQTTNRSRKQAEVEVPPGVWPFLTPASVLHGPMGPQQRPKISGNAVVCIGTTEHLIEMSRLLPERQVPHPPHLVLQPHERAAQT